MLIIDQHIHSNISHDGISSISEHIEYARKNHISEITFTEHYDDYKGINTNLKTLDINKYKDEYLKQKNDKLLKTNFGIEIGLRPESHKQISDMVKCNNFDFIIGSSHITCGKDIAYDKSFFKGITPHQAIIKYLNEVLQNISIYKNEFDVYGHIDYIIRCIIRNYGNVMTKMDYQEFRELLDEILLSLIRTNKGIEINTSGIRYGLGSPHPNIEIINRYRELGGKIITIGSDAHKKEDLGSNFDIAYDMLYSVGFNNVAIYHNRQPEFIKIKKLYK